MVRVSDCQPASPSPLPSVGRCRCPGMQERHSHPFPPPHLQLLLDLANLSIHANRVDHADAGARGDARARKQHALLGLRTAVGDGGQCGQPQGGATQVAAAGTPIRPTLHSIHPQHKPTLHAHHHPTCSSQSSVSTGAVVLATATLSPVSAACSTRSTAVLSCTMRMSAGTLSPVWISTTSPGSSSRAGRSEIWVVLM